MALNIASPGSVRSIVAKFTPADWLRAQELAPHLDEMLRRACQIHRSQPIFDRTGKPTALMLARLSGLRTQNLLVAVSPLVLALERRWQIAISGADLPEADAAPQATLVADPSVGPRLAELAACRLANHPRLRHAPLLRQTDPSGEDTRYLADRDDDRESTAQMSAAMTQPRDLAHLQELLAQLEQSQEDTLSALERIRSRVRGGSPAAEAELLLLEKWQLLLGDAAVALQLPPEAAVLAELNEAVQAEVSAMEADKEITELRRLLDEIAGVEAGSEAKALLDPVAQQARTADPSTMPEESRAAFRALHRLLSTPLHAIDQQDTDLVKQEFGLPVVLAAASCSLIQPGASSPTVPPDPAPDLAADGASRISPAGPKAPEAPEVPATATAPDDPDAERSQLRPPISEPASGVLDPRIDHAVASGHDGLAYWYTVALDLPIPVQTAFEVLALSRAITIDGDECSMRIRELLHDFDATSVAQNAEFLKVLAAGSARALLRMPFSPCFAVLQDAATLLGDSYAGGFLAAVLRAASSGFDLAKLQDSNGGSLPELIADRDSVLNQLASTLDAARLWRIRFARATYVWRRFISDHGPLGSPISGILASSADPAATEDALALAERTLSQLRDVKAIDRLIDDTDAQLNPVAARRSKIIAGARDDLRERTMKLLDALRAYIEVARAVTAKQRAGSSDQSAETVEVLTRATAIPGAADPGVIQAGESAIIQVKKWLNSVLVHHAILPSQDTPMSVVLARDLSRSFELRRLSDGTIIPASVSAEILGNLAGRSADDAYSGYVAGDDHIGAELLIDCLREEGEADLAARLAARQLEDLKISRERLRVLLAKTEDELARALYTALLSESESVTLRGEVDRLRETEVVDFVAAKHRLDEIVAHVVAARDRTIANARQQLDSLDCPEDARRRILRQLDEGDLVNAQEFLAQLAMGTQSLPAEAPTDQTLTAFWPAVVEAMESKFGPGHADQADLRWLEESADTHSAIAGLTILPAESTPPISEGMRAWLVLAREKRGGAWHAALKSVVQLIGLEVKGQFDQTKRYQKMRWWTKCEASPDGQALVPTYGSSSGGHYQLLLCWERVSADRLLELVDERPHSSPVIVLYFNTLSRKDRRTLAERSRPQNRSVSAVVIDNAVIAFLASRPETRLQTTMGITLPFTAINPYTPFVLGDVPREVFYGRREELRRVQDANDALFVYGGRQLGKSALLKTAMREFAETDDRWQSIYIDLKAEGVGEWREPDDIWPVLVPHLKNVGVIDSKLSPKAAPDVVVDKIRRWLEVDPERRILLLLDEADAFLETDARPRAGLAGDARFVNIYRLKSLMDGSNRRFKPVFAGLHQVQRFHSASNGPMAHVGAEIPVGPLPPSEAYKLVVKPLAAIGYRIERPDVAWRLLAYTNYQASLIQLFCDALVRRLSRRALPAGAPPTVISDRDIDETYSDKEVRDQIATRFEWTINLDNRYRVIAYTTAWLTLNADGQVFATVTLYDECKTFWQDGFAELTLDEFSAYLDEMVGLGVLVRTPSGEYGIRSPNVIRLLGSPEEIERRLTESFRLEISRPFDPAMYRRALGSNPDRRSPLSEQQVQQILDSRGRVHVIIGSEALGLDRAVEALSEAASEDTEIQVARCDGIQATLASLPRVRSGRTHIVIDLADADRREQIAALQRLRNRALNDPRITASCLAPPSASWLWDGEVPDVELERVRIRPWTDDSLRAWSPDCVYPLSTAKQRAQLLEATGGWPQLVEAAIRAARSGMPETRACQEVEGSLSDSQGCMKFLLTVGLSTDSIADEIAEIAARWSDEIAFEELVTLVDGDADTVLTSVSRLVDLAILRRGSSGDVYSINPLIARLLRSE